MKTAVVALFLAVPLFVSCGGGDQGGDVVQDPAGAGGTTLERPTAVPAAPGQVRSANLPTVMDTGTGPVELCLGAIAESYPPQCGGPAIPDWDWSAASVKGMFEQQGTIRWGTFAVTGTWDGEEFGVTDAISGALYDPMMPSATPTPSPARAYTDAELQEIATEVGDLPGAQGAYGADGHVFLDVIYDDGSLQAWDDEEYGESVVLVTPALLDVQ